MIDCGLPVDPRDRPTLLMGNGDERHFGVLCKQRLQVREVEPAVQGRDARAWVAPQQGEMQVVAVEVDDIEAGGVLEDQIQQPDVVWQRLMATLVMPQGPGASRDQLRVRLRVTAGEQRDFVSQPHELLG